jgi:hypothetical protein
MVNQLPVDLNIHTRTIIPPKEGWKPESYYVVEVAFFAYNPIHRAIYYSGFLMHDNPCGYNQLWNPCYEGKYEIADIFYLRVIEKLEVKL